MGIAEADTDDISSEGELPALLEFMVKMGLQRIPLFEKLLQKQVQANARDAAEAANDALVENKKAKFRAKQRELAKVCRESLPERNSGGEEEFFGSATNQPCTTTELGRLSYGATSSGSPSGNACPP